MNKLVIEGVPGLEGTYEFEEFEDFTNRELRRIKLLTGLRVGEFDEAFKVGDNDMIVGLAIVVLERLGKQFEDDLLWDAAAGSLIFNFSEEEVEDPTQVSASPIEPSSSERTSSEDEPSGRSSSEPSDSPVNGRSLTGVPDSPSSVISDREISAA